MARDVVDIDVLRTTPFSKLRIADVKRVLRTLHVAFRANARKRDLVDGLSAALLATSDLPDAAVPAAVRIQAAYRGHRERRALATRGPAALHPSLCANEHDPVTLEPLAQIPTRAFFSFRDALHGKVYGFRASSIAQLLDQCGAVNPFNRRPLDDDVVRCARAAFAAAPPEPEERAAPLDVNARAFRTVHAVNVATGCFADEAWFLELDRPELICMYRCLQDFVREQRLRPAEDARRLVDPLASPFQAANLPLFNRRKLQTIVLDGCDALLAYPTPPERSTLGLWILVALCRVSYRASRDLPVAY